MNQAKVKYHCAKNVACVLLTLLVAVAAVWLGVTHFEYGMTRIGATATVTEMSSGITFQARVDTGAAVSSVHCEEVFIENESEDPLENIGKRLRFLLINHQGEQHWIDTTVVDYGKIRSIDAANRRYYVRLAFKCLGVEKQTLVTLVDRRHMQYRMLLGRDFLESDFVVDVTKDSSTYR